MWSQLLKKNFIMTRTICRPTLKAEMKFLFALDKSLLTFPTKILADILQIRCIIYTLAQCHIKTISGNALDYI